MRKFRRGPLNETVHFRIDNTPCEPTEDFAHALRASTEAPGSGFLRLADDYNFDKEIAAALRCMPPDRAIPIAHRYAVPDDFYTMRNYDWAPPTEESTADFADAYRGANPCSRPQIFPQGFRGTIGSGWDKVRKVYNAYAPIARCSRKFENAITRPYGPRTAERDGENFHSEGAPSRKPVTAGYLSSYDGTLPMRCVIRRLASNNDIVRRDREKDNQIAILAKYLRITDVFFAVIRQDKY